MLYASLQIREQSWVYLKVIYHMTDSFYKAWDLPLQQPLQHLCISIRARTHSSKSAAESYMTARRWFYIFPSTLNNCPVAVYQLPVCTRLHRQTYTYVTWGVAKNAWESQNGGHRKSKWLTWGGILTGTKMGWDHLDKMYYEIFYFFNLSHFSPI